MLKRVLIFGLVLICLCGCSAETIKTEKNVREYETDFSTVRAEIIKICGGTEDEFINQINSDIEQVVESDLIAFDSKAQESEQKQRMGNKCLLDISWDIKYNSSDFLSTVEEKYVYTGGAHGSTMRIPRNIDMAAKREIKLADLFAEDGYANTLNRFIAELIQENPDEYKELWAKAEIKDSHQTDFYINDGNLVIFFQPYDLSYYARGFVEFPIPLKELSGYMKEEFKRLAALGQPFACFDVSIKNTALRGRCLKQIHLGGVICFIGGVSQLKRCNCIIETNIKYL